MRHGGEGGEDGLVCWKRTCDRLPLWDGIDNGVKGLGDFSSWERATRATRWKEMCEHMDSTPETA